MLIDVNNLWREYRIGRAEPVLALRGITMTVARGEFVALVGRSGSGKSTLMNLIGGLDRPTRGEITVAGEKLGELSSRRLSLYRRRNVGFIFQSFNLMTSFSAWQNVALPLAFAGAPRAVRRRRALELLERVGLAGRADHRPGELSGGEQQRVAVARSLALEPGLLLCDEPTGNLDTATGGQIVELLREQNRRGAAVIMVTHDAELARQCAFRTLRMADGRFVDEGDSTPEGAP